MTPLFARSPRRARTALASGLLALVCAAPLQAGERPFLRGDVTVSGDVLTLGDLVADAPPAASRTALFRAPALGQTGTIQASRIVSAAEQLGIGAVESSGRAQVTVTRAARHVGSNEIEAVLRKRLAAQFGFDAASTGIVFDGQSPALIVAPDVTGEVAVADLVVDRRSRRIQATVWIGPSPTERRAQLRVGGSLVELVEVAIAGRAYARGDEIRDVAVERRAKDLVPQDAIYDGAALEGRVARRPLAAGTLLRPADLVRPELVTRGDVVTVIYTAPGVSLTMRAKTSDSGALGDTVGVVNPQSKKALQAVVVGPGRVSVSAAPPARLAAVKSAP
jgi:flagella basal body P-ring formation protein FlgA